MWRPGYCHEEPCSDNRECVANCEPQTCSHCGAQISDCVWVTNWGSCGKCWDKGYEEYLMESEYGNQSD